jgi:hypothetical protein
MRGREAMNDIFERGSLKLFIQSVAAGRSPAETLGQHTTQANFGGKSASFSLTGFFAAVDVEVYWKGMVWVG